MDRIAMNIEMSYKIAEMKVTTEYFDMNKMLELLVEVKGNCHTAPFKCTWSCMFCPIGNIQHHDFGGCRAGIKTDKDRLEAAQAMQKQLWIENLK